ncbi:hypothetical protein [Methylobacterium brachythecii]|uniref:Uncharacterized protein n=1 Tax=Methylobacterium brachythecii TaxID=1176177 RepID=A0A7W6F733_9HYPH|nr:hypothetical protein [Methylobacterium brachythecii]MBB3902631.1 hypothetical protein [Methylobacterium brachythecii]GLS42476.1 hypothetical protein GCM10007884_04610 [Methylobacterium brachythecii]
MRQWAAGKVIRTRNSLWPAPRRLMPASPPIPAGGVRAKPLPATALTAADLIAMARAARAASDVKACEGDQEPGASEP